MSSTGYCGDSHAPDTQYATCGLWLWLYINQVQPPKSPLSSVHVNLQGSESQYVYIILGFFLQKKENKPPF